MDILHQINEMFRNEMRNDPSLHKQEFVLVFSQDGYDLFRLALKSFSPYIFHDGQLRNERYRGAKIAICHDDQTQYVDLYKRRL